ncbi:MAG: YciI family protein [Phycisphaeraceae bacterium]
MKYACLVYGDEKAMHEFPVDECIAYSEEIEKSGHRLGGEALQPVETATTVRVRSGSVSTTDGPFAETKEQLAGFYLIEARDLNEAIRIASRIPPARIGSIEVRPVRELAPQQQHGAGAVAGAP